MNYWFLFIAVLSIIGAFFEHVQHSDYSRKHPDYEKCPTAVIGFVLIAVISIIKFFR